jgi:hypothetical protein
MRTEQDRLHSESCPFDDELTDSNESGHSGVEMHFDNDLEERLAKRSRKSLYAIAQEWRVQVKDRTPKPTIIIRMLLASAES